MDRFEMDLDEDTLTFVIAFAISFVSTDEAFVKKSLKAFSEDKGTIVTIEDIKELTNNWLHNQQVRDIVQNSVSD